MAACPLGLGPQAEHRPGSAVLYTPFPVCPHMSAAQFLPSCVVSFDCNFSGESLFLLLDHGRWGLADRAASGEPQVAWREGNTSCGFPALFICCGNGGCVSSANADAARGADL